MSSVGEINGPREYTVDECQEMFVKHLIGVADYWANEDRTESAKDKCRGVVFSMLVLLDGGNGMMPAFDVMPNPHHTDEEFHKERGENWWPDAVIINDCQLHEMMCGIEKKMEA